MHALDPYDLLLPRPKKTERLGGSIPRGILDRPSRIERTDRVPPGGYSLEISGEGTTTRASDDAGARHAACTLSQVRRLPGDSLPAVRFTDAPALRGRGVMLDVSRCRIPTMGEFSRLAGAFASLKLNHTQCYTEHAFAYAAHEPIWRGADPITADEARALGRIFAAHGIELAANQNCFGHLARWLTDPAFAHLAETQGSWDFAGMPRSGPFSLCPIDDRSRLYVEGLLDELLPCFDSPLVNIGCDETHDVGQGRSADAVQRDGKASVYGRFVGEICRAVIARGKTPMFWGDIAREHPDALGLIPQESHAMVWGYEPGHRFDAEGTLHRDAGRPWWACPGTSSWRGFTGRSTERRANIREATRAAISGGAEGLLVTDWGDLGHRQIWPIAMLSIAEAADAAWTGTDRGPRFLEAASLQVFRDDTGTTAGWLEALGDADEPIRSCAGTRADRDEPMRLLNATALFTELHPPPLPLHLPGMPAPWLACRERLVDLRERVPTGAGSLVEAELRHAVECSLWAADVALARRGETAGPGSLNARRGMLKAEQSRIWLERARAGGLEESLGYWNEAGVPS